MEPDLNIFPAMYVKSYKLFLNKIYYLLGTESFFLHHQHLPKPRMVIATQY